MRVPKKSQVRLSVTRSFRLDPETDAKRVSRLAFVERGNRARRRDALRRAHGFGDASRTRLSTRTRSYRRDARARGCHILGSPVGLSVRRRDKWVSARSTHVAETHLFVTAHPVSSSSSCSISRETRWSSCSFAVTGRSSYRSSASRLRGASADAMGAALDCLASDPHSLSVTSLPGPLSPSSSGSRASYRGFDRRLDRNEPAGRRASYGGIEPAAAPRECVPSAEPKN